MMFRMSAEKKRKHINVLIHKIKYVKTLSKVLQILAPLSPSFPSLPGNELKAFLFVSRIIAGALYLHNSIILSRVSLSLFLLKIEGERGREAKREMHFSGIVVGELKQGLTHGEVCAL